jgi:hypothetical protein
MQNQTIVASKAREESVCELKTKKRNLTNDKKDSATLELGSPNSSSVSREEGKRGAREPLYLLRYE